MAQDVPPVVVAGGGLAGLACALALGDAGIPVRLFEGAVRCGGRAQSLIDATTGDAVDIGPHVLTSEHRNMLALLERLGTADDICWQPRTFITLRDHQQTVAMRNHALPAPLHFLPNFLRVRALSLRDVWSARRVLWRVMQLSEDELLALDDRVAEDVLRELGVSGRFIDWFWRTVCLAVMNVPLERCSAASLFRFLKMLSGRSDFHFGFPRGALEALFLPAALHAIRANGGEVHCASPLRRVHANGHVQGVELDDGTQVAAEQCVLALPPSALARVRAGSPGMEAVCPGSGGFAPSAYISVYLWFTQRLTRECFWARTWAPQRLNCDFYDLSNIRDGQHAGSLIASNIIYSQRFGTLSDAEVVAATRRELAAFAPAAARAPLRHARVHRIGMAIAAPYPGFESQRPAIATPLAGLFLAGDWTRTAVPESMESAVRSGFLAAEAVAAERGIGLDCAQPLGPMRGLAGWLWRRRHGDAGAGRDPLNGERG